MGLVEGYMKDIRPLGELIKYHKSRLENMILIGCGHYFNEVSSRPTPKVRVEISMTHWGGRALMSYRR